MSTPNEVYRKDLVSAMTVTDLPDCHQFFYLADNWKTEWERGVQVPAKAKQKKAHVDELESAPQPPIKPPKSRPRYSLDNLDVAWLERANQHRVAASLPTLTEDDLETMIDEFETQANSTIRQKCSNKTVKSMEDNSVCDVCRSPNGEDGNELVFCDGCDICVHQHCYGILKIDDGEDWFCQPCKENLKPKCYLCSQHGGTMKKAIGWEKIAGLSSAPWVHIQCALWIPEITMTDPARMEKPDISHLPESRKSLKCSVCSNAVGCVQCNVKKCYKSYHVTCAVRSGLSVKMETKGGRVNLILHCDKHSETKLDEVRKRRTSIDQQVDEERRFLEENFFTLVSLEHAKNRLTSYSMDTLDWVFEYWRLRRRAGGNQQLFNDNDVEPEAATAEQRYRRITQLRSDLERSRNLLCLIIRREKIKKQVLRCDREIKLKEMKFLGSKVELSESTKSDLKRMDIEFSKAEEKPKTEAEDAAAFLEDLDAPNLLEPVKDVPIVAQPRKPSPKPAPTPSTNAINTNRPSTHVKVEQKTSEPVKVAAEEINFDGKISEPKTEPAVKKEASPEVIPTPIKGTPIKGFNMKNAVSVGQFRVVQGKSKLMSGNPRPIKGFIRPTTNPTVSQAQMNNPRMNGPSMDGKTVIGTKVVGGLNQPVIMESTPGFRMTRPPVVSVPSQIRMRSTPPNIMITPKMVGGKEVRLVTPSFPKPKPGSRARLVRPEVRPQSKRPDTQTPPQVRNPAPVSLPNQATPPPVQSSQHPAQQVQQGPSFQARTPVRGEANKTPNTPPVSKANGPKSGLIKLGAFAKGAKPAAQLPEPKEAAPEEISTRQLTEQLLKVDSKRKSLDKGSAMNNATKEIFDKFKKLDSENKPSPIKSAEKKKTANKGISFGNLFKKDTKSESGNMMNKFKNIFNSTKSKLDTKKKLTPYQKAKQKQSTTVLPLKPTRLPKENLVKKQAKTLLKTEQIKAEVRERKLSNEITKPKSANQAKLVMNDTNGSVQEKIQESPPKENGLPLVATPVADLPQKVEQAKAKALPENDLSNGEAQQQVDSTLDALNAISPEEQMSLCKPLKVLVDSVPNDVDKAAKTILERSTCLSPKRRHSLDQTEGPPAKQPKKETAACSLADILEDKSVEMLTTNQLEAPKIDACPIISEPVATLTPPQAPDELKRAPFQEGIANGVPSKVDLKTTSEKIEQVEKKINESSSTAIPSNKLPLSPPDEEPEQQNQLISESTLSQPDISATSKNSPSELAKVPVGINEENTASVEQKSCEAKSADKATSGDKVEIAKPSGSASGKTEKLPSSPENEDDDLPLDSLVRRDSSKPKEDESLDDLFQPALETPVFEKAIDPLAGIVSNEDKTPSIFPEESLFSSIPAVSAPVSAPVLVPETVNSAGPILPTPVSAPPTSSAPSSEFNPLDELFGSAPGPSTSSKDSICDSFNPLDDIFGSADASSEPKTTATSNDFNITDFIDLDQPLPPPKVVSEQDIMKNHAALANIKSEPFDPSYFSQQVASAPTPVPKSAPRRPSTRPCAASSKAAPAVPPLISNPGPIHASLPASAPPTNPLSTESSATKKPSALSTTSPFITPYDSTGLVSPFLNKPIEQPSALNPDNSSFQNIIKSMVQGVHTLNDKELLAKHVSLLIQQAQPNPADVIRAQAAAAPPPPPISQPGSSSMSKLQALLASPIEPFPRSKVNPFGGLNLLNALKSPPSSSAEPKAPFPASLVPPAQAAPPQVPKQNVKEDHPNIANPVVRPPAKRKNSTARSEKVRKKLTDLPRFNPPKKQQKIIYSPTASAVQVFETPTEVITIKPENEKFADTSPKKKQARKMSDEAYRPGIHPKRARTKSPRRSRGQSPRKGQASSTGNPVKKYNLPKLKIARNQNGESDGKWRIEHVFVCSVPESEIDCTAILDRLSQRRSSSAPPPLQRAPAAASTLRFEIKEEEKPLESKNEKAENTLEKKPIKITLRVPKLNNNQTAALMPMPPPPSGLRTTPRKGASAVKYTDPWWDDS